MCAKRLIECLVTTFLFIISSNILPLVVAEQLFVAQSLASAFEAIHDERLSDTFGIVVRHLDLVRIVTVIQTKQ